MTDAINLEEKQLTQILLEMHRAQKCSFFLEDVMGSVMDKLGYSEEEAIEIIKFLMAHHFISTKSFLPRLYLKPEYVRMFPVVLTAKAITLTKEG